MAKVYIVTDSGFFGYGVFSSEEKANDYIKEHNKAYPSYCPGIEEVEIDEAVQSVAVRLWKCCLEDLEEGTLSEWGTSWADIWPSSQQTIIEGPKEMRDGKFRLHVTSSISQEHANKVAIEKRQEWLRNRVLSPAEIEAEQKRNAT